VGQTFTTIHVRINYKLLKQSLFKEGIKKNEGNEDKVEE
jgi:hypothetical protein